MAVRTLFFRQFRPDRSVFDQESSDVIENVLPAPVGSYRHPSSSAVVGVGLGGIDSVAPL